MWTGLTAFFSLLSGLLTGALPEIVKEVRDTRSDKRERERMQLMHNMQIEREKIGAEQKMREAEANLLAAEVAATREHLTAIIAEQGKPSGFLWIDALNALLRPVACALIIGLFAYTSALFVHGVMVQFGAGKISGTDAATAVWGSLIGTSIEGVLGFLFGYRGYRNFSRKP